MPPFHVYAPFPTTYPRSHLTQEVLQFEYLGLVLDPKLTMHLAANASITRATQGQSLIQAVSYSLRYDKHSSQLTPTQNLGLWKTTVLPHFLQNLRYIHSDTDHKKMQTSLDLSLARSLHVYGDHTALLADTGIPPLTHIRHIHLTQLYFRLTRTRANTLPGTLYDALNRSLPLRNLHPTSLHFHIRQTAQLFGLNLDTDPLPHMSTSPPQNRERAFRNLMRKRISALWRSELYHAGTPAPGVPIGRFTTYICITREDLQRIDLFKPAQYLRTHYNHLPLLRVRTQATGYIPTHLFLDPSHTYVTYDERVCAFCLPNKHTGDEVHTLLTCPHSAHLSQPAIHSLSFGEVLRGCGC